MLAVAGGTLAWFAPVLVNVPDDLVLTVRVAAGVLVLDLILTNLLNSAVGRSGREPRVQADGGSVLVVLAGGALTASAVLLGAGLVGVTLSVVATTVLTGVLYVWVARRYVPWFGMSMPVLRTVAVFLRLSGWFLLWNLVVQLMRGSDVVVLGIADSVEPDRLRPRPLRPGGDLRRRRSSSRRSCRGSAA